MRLIWRAAIVGLSFAGIAAGQQPIPCATFDCVISNPPSVTFDQGAAEAMESIDKGLPAFFQGIDELKFVKLLYSATGQKSQFETRDDYDKRVAATLANLAPIDLQTIYPLKVYSAKQSYDAEKEISTISFEFSDAGTDHIFELGYWTKKGDTYIGQNAFGVLAEVNVETITVPIIAVPRNSPVLATKVGLTFGYGTITIQTHWPRAEAQAVGRENPLSVLFLARLSSPVCSSKEWRHKPAIDDRVDRTETKIAFHGDLREIVVYVEATGKVLQRFRATANGTTDQVHPATSRSLTPFFPTVK